MQPTDFTDFIYIARKVNERNATGVFNDCGFEMSCLLVSLVSHLH